jgi:membrane associated rhomboid family serine protease
MIPVSDVIRSRTTPWATIVLVAANVIVFLYERTLANEAVPAFLDRFAFDPVAPSWATATSALFIHENSLHAATNALLLWVFGDNVEDQLGHGRFVLFYAIAGYAGWAAEIWASSALPVPLVGASGAVAGVTGAYFLMFPRSRVLVIVPARTVVDALEVPAALLVAVWFPLQVLGGLGRLADPAVGLAGIALWTHVGGFLTGGLAVKLLRQPARAHVEWWGA